VLRKGWLPHRGTNVTDRSKITHDEPFRDSTGGIIWDERSDCDLFPVEQNLFSSQLQEFIMSPRIYICEARVFRNSRGKEVLCRLKYEVTSINEGLFRWFLLDIEELE
jgi:hypothetical protein